MYLAPEFYMWHTIQDSVDQNDAVHRGQLNYMKHILDGIHQSICELHAKMATLDGDVSQMAHRHMQDRVHTQSCVNAHPGQVGPGRTTAVGTPSLEKQYTVGEQNTVGKEFTVAKQMPVMNRMSHIVFDKASAHTSTAEAPTTSPAAQTNLSPSPGMAALPAPSITDMTLIRSMDCKASSTSTAATMALSPANPRACPKHAPTSAPLAPLPPATGSPPSPGPQSSQGLQPYEWQCNHSSDLSAGATQPWQQQMIEQPQMQPQQQQQMMM